MTHSALYRGVLSHTRHLPRRHAFAYRLSMLYLDLDELPQLFDGIPLWSARRPAPAWFRRADFLGSPLRPLADSARDLVQQRCGRRPTGPVRVLTQLRYFGYQINPVRLYFLFDADGSAVEAVIAEVTNTPWGERHCYVLHEAVPGADGVPCYAFDKVLHVSPFMPPDVRYEWALPVPGTRFYSVLTCRRQGAVWFEAQLALERRPIDAPTLLRTLARQPLPTARIALAIYWQAARLWCRRLPRYRHPPGGRV
ncbi:MAG: DUF1365 domain-containing protein [Immundisolibacter sp.]